MATPLVILDADGVFLNERPYWEAALLTALSLNSLNVPKGRDWVQLADAAFGELGLQRVTKRRGCNSNWDLAAVLMITLRDAETKCRIGDLLAGRHWQPAMRCLLTSSDRLWNNDASPQSVKCPAMDDPLAGFRVDRYGEDFAVVRRTFQQSLHLHLHSVGQAASSLRGDPDTIRATLSELRNEGFTLAVCTGRTKAALLTPMNAFALTRFFDSDRLVTADDVSQTEQALATGVPLGKPHWFPAALAALGPAAREAVVHGRLASVPHDRLVYVGDGVADFQCVAGARAVGLPLEYVHVRSGVTDTDEERLIADAPFALAIVDELAEVPALLRRTRSGIPS